MGSKLAPQHLPQPCPQAWSSPSSGTGEPLCRQVGAQGRVEGPLGTPRHEEMGAKQPGTGEGRPDPQPPSAQEAKGSSPARDTSQLGQEGACRPSLCGMAAGGGVCPGTPPGRSGLCTQHPSAVPLPCVLTCWWPGEQGTSAISPLPGTTWKSRVVGVGRVRQGWGPLRRRWGGDCLSSTKASPQLPDLSSPETSEMDGLGFPWVGWPPSP